MHFRLQGWTLISSVIRIPTHFGLTWVRARLLASSGTSPPFLTTWTIAQDFWKWFNWLWTDELITNQSQRIHCWYRDLWRRWRQIVGRWGRQTGSFEGIRRENFREKTHQNLRVHVWKWWALLFEPPFIPFVFSQNIHSFPIKFVTFSHFFHFFLLFPDKNIIGFRERTKTVMSFLLFSKRILLIVMMSRTHKSPNVDAKLRYNSEREVTIKKSCYPIFKLKFESRRSITKWKNGKDTMRWVED